MPDWVLVSVIIAAAFFAVVALVGRKRAGENVSPYQQARVLFSAAERSFLGVLDQAVGEEFRAFGKVRVADVVPIRRGLNNATRQSAFNRISAKHFDFIVCRADDLSVVCAVELNDKSHSSERAQSRDTFLAEVCRSIDLPFFVVLAKRAYSLRDVRDQFVSATASPTEERIVA